MAVTHFIQTIWSKKILDELELKCKLVDNCHRGYEGDCKYAQSVKILSVGDPTVGDYDGTDIDIEAMSDASQVLTIDQAKYFAFYVDDVDKAQSVPGLPEEFRRKAVHALAVARDTFIAGKIKGVTTAGHVTTAANLTGADVKAAIDKGIVALRKRNFEEEGVIEIDPETYNVLKDAIAELSTNNPDYIKTGKIGTYNGMDVIMSNNMASDTNYNYCDIRGKKAIAFAGQIDKVEACRAEKRFADIVKGLDVYGAKVIDEDRIQVIKVPKTYTAPSGT